MNEPGTLPSPPLRVEFDNAWPKVIAEAVGSVVVEEEALFSTTVGRAFMAVVIPS